MDSQYIARPRVRPTAELGTSASFINLLTDMPSDFKTPIERGEAPDTPETIVFVNHVHDSYVWPYESASSYEVFLELGSINFF